MNLFLNTVIICQIEDIFTTQKAIIEKENNTYYAIGDATNYLTEEMYKAVVGGPSVGVRPVITVSKSNLS